MKKLINSSLTTVLGILLLTGCSDADIASHDLSTDADNFNASVGRIFKGEWSK